MVKQRLDTRLVELALCDSRQQAQRLIRAGAVMVNQQVMDKPGTEIDRAATVTVKARSPYVSRGGEKLAKALTTFSISVRDRICLDAGISTGGFTDCLLQAGAQQVYGIDVGYGQVAWSLRQDQRVILRERTNIRYLKPEDLYPEDSYPADLDREDFESTVVKAQSTDRSAGSLAKRPNLGVADVSFISLTKILPALWSLLSPPREVVLLVKPQFEVGKEKVGKKGVVRAAKDQVAAIAQVLTAAEAIGWQYGDLTWSPLLGPAGNIEYLLWLKMPVPESMALGQTLNRASPHLARLEQTVQAAQLNLQNPSSQPRAANPDAD